jgi:hypothetical protein
VNEALVQWLRTPGASGAGHAPGLPAPSRVAPGAAHRGVGIDAFVIQRWSEYSRDLCVGCVRQEYLETALADRELQGCWGGTTEAERREIRLQRVAVASRITEPGRVSSLFRWVAWEAL